MSQWNKKALALASVCGKDGVLAAEGGVYWTSTNTTYAEYTPGRGDSVHGMSDDGVLPAECVPSVRKTIPSTAAAKKDGLDYTEIGDEAYTGLARPPRYGLPDKHEIELTFCFNPDLLKNVAQFLFDGHGAKDPAKQLQIEVIRIPGQEGRLFRLSNREDPSRMAILAGQGPARR